MSEESAEELVEEKPEKKVKKVKKVEKKEKSVFRHYKVEGEKLKRMLPFCERCGPGYFMADHGDRYTCGHCGFSVYKPAETKV